MTLLKLHFFLGNSDKNNNNGDQNIALRKSHFHQVTLTERKKNCPGDKNVTLTKISTFV